MDLLQIIDCYVASGSCSLHQWEDVYNGCHGENNGYDMSGPVDVKPKQEIEDCGNKVGKRLFTWHSCRSKAVVQTC